ncbi:MAG: preprotein translocase subunit SecA, partial [Kiritimatiellae bacterium]|nr:preprotein translocase subunit SecA [Kiritimatiellia bacterium]
MASKLLSKIFGSKGERDLKKIRPLVASINELDEEYKALSDSELQAKTDEFKARLKDGATTDDIMAEAFAVVKNACRRLVGTEFSVCGHDMTWDMVPFDVQLIGSIVLHQGRIAEMATGEGKTLVAVMPLYLNALEEKGTHLVTVNDYLARRDSQWMGLVFEYLGLTCGCIQNQMHHDERKTEYAKDITYGTNSEFGFDYLRDNGMAFDEDAQVQRGYHYAIIDEIDSILIDEARTPLIISGPAPVSSHQYFSLKPKVEALFKKQQAFCNRIVKDAKDLIDKNEIEEAQLKLYQVSQGMPKHKQLMHMLENPEIRKLNEKISNAMLTDMRKEQSRALREELFFTIDERNHDAGLTEKGCAELNPDDPDSYVLPDLVTAIAEMDADDSISDDEKSKLQLAIQDDFTTKSERIHNVDQLIRAYCLYEKDVEYVVQNNQVIIVDENTGRLMSGRRWSDGLHQAVEAIENVKIERETQTLATITIQNYFRTYTKLSGMTGTAETEANEFHDIYGLEVIVIPTNRPIRRVDSNDVIYKTHREKYKAIINEVITRHKEKQPLLVGTVSVESSELISRMLKRAGIVHSVLNAKNHEREADIVTRAGQPGAVTIATNMAGRGTDIKLGTGVVGIAEDVIKSQTGLNDKVDGESLHDIIVNKHRGLHVIGSGRHESRRTDRQLRGRCARQGDPGSSKFYISLEDDLMRLFGSDRIASIMSHLGLEEGQELEHKWLNRSIETAQRRVEQQNYSMRKRTLEYDDVINKQREIVYSRRRKVLQHENIADEIQQILKQEARAIADAFSLNRKRDAWDLDEIIKQLSQIYSNGQVISHEHLAEFLKQPELQNFAVEYLENGYKSHEENFEKKDALRFAERQIYLATIDRLWMEHLENMRHLREKVSLRGFGQRDPLIEYKNEAYLAFEELLGNIRGNTIRALFKLKVEVTNEPPSSLQPSMPQKILTNEGNIEDILTGDRELTPEQEKGVAAAAQQFLKVDEKMKNLGNTGVVKVRVDSNTKTFTQKKISNPTIIRATNSENSEVKKAGRNDPCPCGAVKPDGIPKKYKQCC